MMRHRPLIATIGVFILLTAIASLRYKGFFSTAVFLDLFRDNAFLGIAAIGATFVILSGGIDLSVGAVIGFTSILIATLVETYRWPPPIAIVAALGIGSVFGAGMGVLVAKFRIPPFLVSLAGMFLARGLGLTLSLQSIELKNPFFAAISDHPYALPILFLATFGVGLGLLHLRPFGRNVVAIGGREESARLMGVPVDRTKVGVYALAGFCSALAGVAYTVYTGAGNANGGTLLELDAIAAVVIGGTLLTGGVGGLVGTLFGVLTLGVIQTAITFEGTLSSWWTKIAIGGLLLAFIVGQRLAEGKRMRE